MKSKNKKKNRERERERERKRNSSTMIHTCVPARKHMYIWIRENGRFCQSGKKHFLVRVGDALEAETIFDSTHAKIHIAALKEGREKPKEGREGGRERERERERERNSRRMANRRVCKCSTRGCDAVMEEKNCLFQRPAFSQAYYPPGPAR